MGLGIHRVSGLPPHPIPGASVNGCYPIPLRVHLGGSGSRGLKPIQLEKEWGIRGKRWVSYRSGSCCYPHPSVFEITAKKLPATYWFQPFEPRYLKSSFFMLFLIITITHNHARLPASPLPLWPIASLRQDHHTAVIITEGPMLLPRFCHGSQKPPVL